MKERLSTAFSVEILASKLPHGLLWGLLAGLVYVVPEVGPRLSAAVVGGVGLWWALRDSAGALGLLLNGQLIYFILLYQFGLAPEPMVTGLWFILLSLRVLWPLLLDIRQRNIFVMRSADAWLYLLSLLLLVSAVMTASEGNEFVWKKLLYWPFLVLIPYVAVRQELAKRGPFHIFGYAAAVAALIGPMVLVHALTEEATATRLSLFKFGETEQDNPILIGSTFALPLVLFLGWGRRGMFRVTPFVTLLISGFLMLRAGGRGPVLAFAFAAVAVGMLRRSGAVFLFSRLGRFLLAVTLLSGLGLLAIRLLPEETVGFYKQAIDIVDGGVPDVVSSAVYRYRAWESSVDLFVSSPLSGVGFGNFGSAGGYLPFPHSLILEVAVELGIVGLVLLGGFLWSGLATVASGTQKAGQTGSPIVQMVFLVQIFYLAGAMVSGFLTNQIQLFMVWAMGCGLVARRIWIPHERELVKRRVQRCG